MVDFVLLDLAAQAAIACFGVLAVFLVAKKNKRGFVFGLLSQPFWFITSFVHAQWGVFFVSIVYAFVWCLGIYEWFFKKAK